jgi:hypothetical protein
MGLVIPLSRLLRRAPALLAAVPRSHAPAWERIPSLDTTYCSQSAVSVPTEDRGNQGTQHSGRPCRVSAKAPTQPTQAVKPSGAINPINITVALAILLSSRPATQQKIGAGLLEWPSPASIARGWHFLCTPSFTAFFPASFVSGTVRYPGPHQA